jgi:hypothetical protein
MFSIYSLFLLNAVAFTPERPFNFSFSLNEGHEIVALVVPFTTHPSCAYSATNRESSIKYIDESQRIAWKQLEPLQVYFACHILDHLAWRSSPEGPLNQPSAILNYNLEFAASRDGGDFLSKRSQTLSVYTGDTPGLILSLARQIYGADIEATAQILAHFSKHYPSSLIGGSTWRQSRWKAVGGGGSTGPSSRMVQRVLRAFPDEVIKLQSLIRLESFTAGPTSKKVKKRSRDLSPDQNLNDDVSIAISTCKRLHLFVDTARHLRAVIGSQTAHGTFGGSNLVIREILVVDDGSSVDDWESMKRQFPEFRFAKARGAGHAASLNLMLSMIRTRFLLYLEDDWRFLPNPTLSPAMLAYVRNRCRYFVGAGDVSYDTPGKCAFLSMLDAARRILLVEGANRSSITSGGVVQVLFNAQSSRFCATGGEQGVGVAIDAGTPALDINSEEYEVPSQCVHESHTLVDGGWLRKLDGSIDNLDKKRKSMKCESAREVCDNYEIDYSLLYSEHEFAIPHVAEDEYFQTTGEPPVSSQDARSTSDAGETLQKLGFRNHDFSYWPGLSLNPGLWDVPAVVSGLILLRKSILCEHETQEARILGTLDSAQGSEHFVECQSRASLTSTQQDSERGPVLRQEQEHGASEQADKYTSYVMFDEKDPTFEQRWSLMTHAAGLRMTFLHTHVFLHTGARASAYSITGRKRPWDPVHT